MHELAQRNIGVQSKTVRSASNPFCIKPSMTRLTFIAVAAAFLLAVANLRTPLHAQTITTDQPVGTLEGVATFSGPMPTGVTISRRNRIFVNFPRWGDVVPYTVAEVVNGQAVAYPNQEINDEHDPLNAAVNAQHFISVQSVVVDPADRLWVLDTGAPLMGHTIPNGPKLVAIDLATNKVIKTILFPIEIAGPNSYLNDVRFDLTVGTELGGIRGTAYITDSSSNGPNGIVVVDLATGKSWRRLNNHPSTMPEPGFVIFAEGRPIYSTEPGKPPSPLKAGTDGIAISNDGSKIFYCALSSTKLYSVSAAALRDQSQTEAQVIATIHLVTGKAPSDGLESDTDGNIYATDYNSNSIQKIAPNGMIETIVHNPTLLWPDTMSLSDDGYLYVTSNQLERQPSFHNGKDQRQKPYVLFRVKLNAKPVRLIK
jgi:sugar lactone lactonase YvrE